MILSPSRSGAFALVSVVGCGLLFGGPSATFLNRAAAQSGDAAPTVATAQPAGPSPTPAADAGMARTDAPGRHLAPHGTLYLLDYVSVTTDTGVDGFVPGQEVHVVSADRARHILTVTDGKTQVEVPPSKLTNDIDIAAMVRQQDQAKQARVAAYVQAEQAAFAKHEREEAETEARNDENQKLAAQQAADARLAAQNAPQPVNASPGNGAGYYDSGGYGYGSPYSYFSGSGVVVAGPNRDRGASGQGGGRDTLPSDRASTNSADVERGNSAGAAAGGARTGGGGGGGHPGGGGGKP